MAGAGAITGALLSSGGYIANQTQSDGAMLAIKACYLYIPALLIVASMLWIGRFYRLDDQYEQIRATLTLDAVRRRTHRPLLEKTTPCKAQHPLHTSEKNKD
ncbi:Xyloside transporter XynT [Klebsiella oxytoca]|nr:Xyloside transporter XynT [Klebsiella oxytoca]